MNLSLSGITRSAAVAALTVAVAAGAVGLAAATATDLAPAVLACEECPAGEYAPIWPDAAPWIVFAPAPGTDEED